VDVARKKSLYEFKAGPAGGRLRRPSSAGSQAGTGMSAKPYDLFVSYSHTDRELVQRVARALTTRKARVWFDGWEMKPGDTLRDRLSDGIANASYMLVILSQSSLGSNWVKYELNSGMIFEIEQDRVKVIPALAPGVEYSMLPADLRAKYCLDFRSPEAFDGSIEAIINLVQPELRVRHELLRKLRKPEGNDRHIVQELGLYANSGRDQTVQIAALSGLQSIPGADATLAVAERALDLWGVKAIERALLILSRRVNDGGLLALVAILLTDDRYFFDKLRLILESVRTIDVAEYEVMSRRLSGIIEDTTIFEVPGVLQRILFFLEISSIEDISYGATLCRLDNWYPRWAGQHLDATGRYLDATGRYTSQPQPNQQAMREAESYAGRRLPGLVDIMRRARSRN
jgi:hypothetical protein